MRTLSFVIALLISAPCFTQVLAGQEFSDQAIVEVGYSIQSNEPWFVDSLEMDFDCDEIIDLTIYFEVGQPEVDGSHYLRFASTNAGLAVALTPGPSAWQNLAILYQANDVIEESDPDEWENNSGVIAGFGGWTNKGAPMVDELFMGYKLGDNFGWVEISYDLTNTIISMEIPRYLMTCIPQDISSLEERITIGPNPVIDQQVSLHSSTKIARAELWTLEGRQIHVWENPEQRLSLDVAAGNYVLILTSKTGMESRHILAVKG